MSTTLVQLSSRWEYCFDRRPSCYGLHDQVHVQVDVWFSGTKSWFDKSKIRILLLRESDLDLRCPRQVVELCQYPPQRHSQDNSNTVTVTQAPIVRNVMSTALGQTVHLNRGRGIVSPYTILSKFQEYTRELGTRARLDSRWRNNQVLLLDCLDDKKNPWITGNPIGDMTHLSFALAKYVQDTLWREVSWIPAPSA